MTQKLRCPSFWDTLYPAIATLCIQMNGSIRLQDEKRKEKAYIQKIFWLNLQCISPVANKKSGHWIKKCKIHAAK